jgi:hypothetical protein
MPIAVSFCRLMAGLLYQGVDSPDKYRFDSFVGFPILAPHIGGTNELADSL